MFIPICEKVGLYTFNYKKGFINSELFFLDGISFPKMNFMVCSDSFSCEIAYLCILGRVHVLKFTV